MEEKKKLHHLQHNEKIIIMNIIKFFDKEKSFNAPVIPFSYSVKRAAVATGVSESSIKRLRRLLNSATSDKEVSLTPKKRLRAKKILIEDLSICIIRRKIIEFYLDKKEIPSLKKLLSILKEEIRYEGGREHLRKLLLDVGYKFKKCADKKQIMLERSDIIAARSRYLRKLRCNDSLEKLRKPIIYLDEIYIGPSLIVSKDRHMKDTNVTHEYRWVIVHVAKIDNFVPANLLIYNSKTKIGEPHDTADITTFKNWITEKLLPSLVEPSIIISGNLPYYACDNLQTLPPPSAKKHILQEWLTTNQIHFEEDMHNAELYELIQQHKPRTKFIVDEVFKMHGHELVHLPQYHADLNPIEYMWKVMKERIGILNPNTFKLVNDVAKLVEEAFMAINSDDWFREVWNVKNLEWQYWNIDTQMEEEITKLGILEDSDDGINSEEDK